MLFYSCLTLGIILIAVAAVWGLFVFRPEKQPQLSKRGKSAGNRRTNTEKADQQRLMLSQMTGETVTLNYDAFADPDLCVPKTLLPQENKPFEALEALIIDDDDAIQDAVIHTDSSEKKPQLQLASLMEIQHHEMQNNENIKTPARPRILGDTACELGIRYFNDLLRHHVVPRGARHLTSEANIQVALSALKTARQSATLSHGAVAQRIGERAVCLFEPLETAVNNIDKAVELMAEVFENKTVFIILANTDDVPGEYFAHLNPICARYHIAKTCFYIEQPDGSFINYVEDTHDFVPARLDPMFMPQNFFSELLDYAHTAYDDGDYEAVYRTLAPLLEPLYARVRSKKDFPRVLIAQALNLMGMTHRDVGNDDAAISCFDHSLVLLREIEDYEAIKSVKANLGITLALSRPVTQPKIELAIRHLNEVTQLNPRDDEAWLYLANSYLEQFRMTGAQSLLRRAYRAYEKAYDIAPNPEIASCMEALNIQMGGKKRQATHRSTVMAPAGPMPAGGDGHRAKHQR
jgi:tetratricopeptide (TPR) repeat protein